MKVLITGAHGQLGLELVAAAPEGVQVTALTREALDITDARAVSARVAEAAPDAVINAAAYTAVDRAESERERAFAVNEVGAVNVATAAVRHGARLIHVSTDFVFDGRQSTPYEPSDAPNPLSVYGASKLAGEAGVRRQAGERALIVRTAWVYSAHGHNFVGTMLRLMAEKDELRVVCDQIGTPTWAAGLATALWAALETDARGVRHWTDAGVASWYDFAVAIQEEGQAAGLLDRAIPIVPIRANEYPTPAPRPACAVLDKSDAIDTFGQRPMHWRAALRRMLAKPERGISK